MCGIITLEIIISKISILLEIYYSSKIYKKSKNYLGRRLSIIDIVYQPYEFQNLSLIFNGEIYNYIELRDLLKKYLLKTIQKF